MLSRRAKKSFLSKNIVTTKHLIPGEIILFAVRLFCLLSSFKTSLFYFLYQIFRRIYSFTFSYNSSYTTLIYFVSLFWLSFNFFSSFYCKYKTKYLIVIWTDGAQTHTSKSLKFRFVISKIIKN